MFRSPVKDSWNEVVSRAFDLVASDVCLIEGFRLGQDGSLGIHSHHDAFGTLLLQLATDPANRATSTRSKHHHVNLNEKGIRLSNVFLVKFHMRIRDAIEKLSFVMKLLLLLCLRIG